jgi:hypothetical protein
MERVALCSALAHHIEHDESTRVYRKQDLSYGPVSITDQVDRSLHTYQRSIKTTIDQMRDRKAFSPGLISHAEQSRLSPNEFESATAVPTIPPLPNMEVLGLPWTLSMIDMTVEIPGDRKSSECSASLACTHM